MFIYVKHVTYAVGAGGGGERRASLRRVSSSCYEPRTAQSAPTSQRRALKLRRASRWDEWFDHKARRRCRRIVARHYRAEAAAAAARTLMVTQQAGGELTSWTVWLRSLKKKNRTVRKGPRVSVWMDGVKCGILRMESWSRRTRANVTEPRVFLSCLLWFCDSSHGLFSAGILLSNHTTGIYTFSLLYFILEIMSYWNI